MILLGFAGDWMKHFVEGADRGQIALFPECLDDWVDETNPVRVIDAFVDALNLAELGFEGVEPADTGRSLSSFGSVEALCLRLSQPGAVEPAPRARDRPQCRADVAAWPACPRPQNGGRLPEGQRPCHPQGVRALCRTLPGDGSACEGERGDRWQQVQGGEQSRSELHAGESGAAAGAARRERGTLSEPARHGRPL